MASSDEKHVNVHIRDGILRGKICETFDKNVQYYSFTGIPYAEPPVGKLRFRAPRPIQSWSGIKDVTNNDDIQYLQFDGSIQKMVGVEELVLNVYTPRISTDSKRTLPVMVYFHHGGFLWGNGSKNHHGPDFLVEKDVVYVSVNYRLGVFGFLCLDIPECPGNAGMKDQILALKWVQENISKFSGDSNSVTIFGVSAGAASVGFHLISPMSNNLFHKAIIQSGSALGQWSLTTSPTETALRFAKTLGYKKNTIEDILPFLEEADPNNIIQALTSLTSDVTGLYLPFSPVIEKEFKDVEAFIMSHPLHLMVTGQFKVLPTIVGFCESEGLGTMKWIEQSYLDLQKDANPRKYIRVNFDDATALKVNEEILNVYSSKQTWVTDFFGDLDVGAGVWTTAKYLSSKNPQVYVYNFGHKGMYKYFSSLYGMDPPFDGVTHLDELGYLMSAKFLPNFSRFETDNVVRARMVTLWTNFAKFGEPTPQMDDIIKTKWTPVSSNGDDSFNVLNIKSELSLETNAFKERRKFWNYIFTFYEDKYSIKP